MTADAEGLALGKAQPVSGYADFFTRHVVDFKAD